MKINIICGLIGSGKTTWCKSQNIPFTDLDYLPNYATKKEQISLTKKVLRENSEVNHITTFPTEEEMKAFENYNTSFYWIDTDLERCKLNILVRNRKRDMDNLKYVYDKNEELLQKAINSEIIFKAITVIK